MDGPIITRDGKGNIQKHWTTEAAEAADRAARDNLAAKIRAQRVVRPTLFDRLAAAMRRVSSLLTPDSSRRPKAERI